MSIIYAGGFSLPSVFCVVERNAAAGWVLSGAAAAGCFQRRPWTRDFQPLLDNMIPGIRVSAYLLPAVFQLKERVQCLPAAAAAAAFFSRATSDESTRREERVQVFSR